MKKILIFMLLFSLTSCWMEEKKVPTRELVFVVSEKVTLSTGQYYLKSKDTILRVNPNDYMRYDLNDTIRFEIDTEGFFRGTLFLKK